MGAVHRPALARRSPNERSQMGFRSDDEGGVSAVTSLALATQRFLAHVVSSPRWSFQHRVAAMLGCAELPGRSELAGLRPLTRFLIIGLVAWIGLIALVTVLAVASVEMSAINFPSWLGARVSASSSREMRPPSSFENILQRPLFSRSRQAAAAAPVASLPSPSPSPAPVLDPSIALKGVFINGASAKAFLTSAQNPLGGWFQINDEIAGWRIVAVKPDRIVLDGQNQKLTLPLSNSSAK